MVDKPTSKRGIRNFAIKTAISATMVSLSLCASKHPETIMKGRSAVMSFVDKNGSNKMSTVEEGIKYYSESLGRFLTKDEINRMSF